MVLKMEFNEKIQELRKQKGLTQEELAKALYVSRTAISKWESGRGYPNIESLKSIATFFSVTVDELLSSTEVLTLAEKDNKQKEKHFRDLVYGSLDMGISMLLFLPFFATKSNGVIQSVSLISIGSIQLYLKAIYFVAVFCMIITGILTLTLQNCRSIVWDRIKVTLSLILSVILVVVFMISLQPYAAIFAFILLSIKCLILIKR